MTDADLSVAWPAVLKQGEDPELLPIMDLAQWKQYQVDQAWHSSDTDQLIDRNGALYRLSLEGSTVRLNRQQPDLTLTDVLGLVKAHMAQAGSCCVAKLYAPTIADALQLLIDQDLSAR